MAQERLDGHQIHATFQKMGRETMPQRVNAFAFFNAAFLLGSIVDFLDCGDIQRAISVLAKKDPRNRLISLLVSLQLTEQPLGENRVTVFFPFALFYADHHPLGMDIAQFEVNQLADPKPCRIGRH